MAVKFERVTDNAPWSIRGLHKAMAFNGRLLIYGGRHGATYLSDAWETGNGSDWTAISPDAGLGGLCSYGAAVHNRRLYISNGLPDSEAEVVHSLDANLGKLDTINAGWPGRYDGEMCSYDEHLWMMGGEGADMYNDVWKSRDGVQWARVLANGHTQWTPRMDHRLVVHDGYMWIIGGVDDNGPCSDVWYSSNGYDWTQAISVAPFGAIYDHGLVSYDRRLVVVTRECRLWHSLDGTLWVDGGLCEMPARGEFGLEVYDNRIYLLGGAGAQVDYNDVWRTVGTEF